MFWNKRKSIVNGNKGDSDSLGTDSPVWQWLAPYWLTRFVMEWVPLGNVHFNNFSVMMKTIVTHLLFLVRLHFYGIVESSQSCHLHCLGVGIAFAFDL